MFTSKEVIGFPPGRRTTKALNAGLTKAWPHDGKDRADFGNSFGNSV
jgi:hypothetical protein